MLDSADVRKLNRYKIQQVMWKGGEYTKQSISKLTGLSVATCNTLLNDLEKTGEIVGEKQRLNDVGRSTISYHVNEDYENILCIRFEVVSGIKLLSLEVLSMINHAVIDNTIDCERIDAAIILNEIKKMLLEYPNISCIIVGTPSIAEHGIIRHCDIRELEGEPLIEKIENSFHIPTYMENDMYYKAYGYYKIKGDKEAVVTLANFPSHVLPGTATIHKGVPIKGKNGFAGMVGFLPYGISREQQLELLQIKTCHPFILKASASIIAIMNPNHIVFTGDLLDKKTVQELWKECLDNIPLEYMPTFSFEKNMDTYYLQGMYQKALDLKGVF